jgi:hypothetical protein
MIDIVIAIVPKQNETREPTRPGLLFTCHSRRLGKQAIKGRLHSMRRVASRKHCQAAGAAAPVLTLDSSGVAGIKGAGTTTQAETLAVGHLVPA